jgi:hypothetical protein
MTTSGDRSTIPARADRTPSRKLTFALRRGSVALEPRHVALLVESLRLLRSADGRAVADEVSSLAGAGVRIDLRLNASELHALADALVRLHVPSRPVEPGLARLLAQVREEQAPVR